MGDTILFALYMISLIALGLFGIHKYHILHKYRKYSKNPLPQPADPDEWPLVAIQLPIYNEVTVVERLLHPRLSKAGSVDVRSLIETLDHAAVDTVAMVVVPSRMIRTSVALVLTSVTVTTVSPGNNGS